MLDHKYTIFYHLAKNPNTTQVAETLRLSQPAISKSIKELEKELSINLFDRIKGRLRLTTAGEYLLKETEIFLKREREIRFGIDHMKQTLSGELNIGASTTLAQYILPGILAAFSSGNDSGLKINAISGNTSQIEKEIQNNNLHLAFIEGSPNQPDIHYIPFLKDEIVLVCAPATSSLTDIDKNQLKQLKFVWREKGSGTYNIIKKALHNINIDIADLHEQLTLGTTEGIKKYLQLTDCFALLSIYSVRDELAAGKLRIIDTDELSIDRTFYIIHKQGVIDPYAQKFIDFTLNSKNRTQYL